jgi:hypothetical protein
MPGPARPDEARRRACQRSLWRERGEAPRRAVRTGATALTRRLRPGVTRQTGSWPCADIVTRMATSSKPTSASNVAGRTLRPAVLRRHQ